MDTEKMDHSKTTEDLSNAIGHGRLVSEEFKPGLVSVVIPTFNRADLISETLDSILGQTYSHWECIIVDDGSQNETRVVIEQYMARDDRFRFFERPANRKKGACACRNYGFEVSNGEYVHFIDSDDLMHPENLRKKVEVLQDNQQYDFVVCQLKSFEDDPSNIVRHHTAIKSNNAFVDHVCGKIAFFTLGPLWRRCLLLSLDELFDEDLSCGQEYGFHSSLLLHTQSYGTIDESLVFSRFHARRISKNRNHDYHFSAFRARRNLYELARSHNKLSVPMIEYFMKIAANSFSEGLIIDNQKFLDEVAEFTYEVAPKNFRGAWYLWNMRIAMLANKYLGKRTGWLISKILNKLVQILFRLGHSINYGNRIG